LRFGLGLVSATHHAVTMSLTAEVVASLLVFLTDKVH
jgi:hypothetical protein